MSMFFSAIFPLGYWYSALACFFSYWVDKYAILRLLRQKPPSGDRLVRITRTTVACIVLVHTIVTAHFYYAWPFDNLCPTLQKLLPNGTATAKIAGVDNLDQYFEQCRQTSDALLPPDGRQRWFQEGDDQTRLVHFYRIVSILIIVYILIFYFGSDSVFSIYALWFHRHQSVGEAKTIPFCTVSSAEAYVPQINVPGLHHAVMTCMASTRLSQDKAHTDSQHSTANGPSDAIYLGGLQFDPELLNWTPMKEVDNLVGNCSTENIEDEEKGHRVVDNEGNRRTSAVVLLTSDEKDTIYRSSNICFDEQLQDQFLSPKYSHLRGVLGSVKQYIKLSKNLECSITPPLQDEEVLTTDHINKDKKRWNFAIASSPFHFIISSDSSKLKNMESIKQESVETMSEQKTSLVVTTPEKPAVLVVSDSQVRHKAPFRPLERPEIPSRYQDRINESPLWKRLQVSIAAAHESERRHRQHVNRLQASAAQHRNQRSALANRATILFDAMPPLPPEENGTLQLIGTGGAGADDGSYRTAASHVYFAAATNKKDGGYLNEVKKHKGVH